MKLNHPSSEHNLMLNYQREIHHIYTQPNFNQHQTFNRLLTTIHKIIQEPQIWKDINQPQLFTSNVLLSQDFNINEKFVQQEFQEIDMDIENFVEYNLERPKLKNKTSIENRMPLQEADNDADACILTISASPIENLVLDIDTARVIDTDDCLNVQHLETLFRVQETNLMVLCLGYLSKLSCSKSEYYYEMNSILRKFSVSYLLACKVKKPCEQRRVIGELSSALGLDPDTLVRMERQFLVSVGFNLQLSKECLQKVQKAILGF